MFRTSNFEVRNAENVDGKDIQANSVPPKTTDLPTRSGKGLGC